MTPQRKKALTFLCASVALAGTAVYLASRYVKSTVDKKTSHLTVPVVVSTGDISPGDSVKGHLEIMQWPTDVPLTTHFSSVSEASSRVAISKIGLGEPITENMLAPKGAVSGLSALVEPGLRAVTVKINEVSGVAGFLIPGNHVDLIVNMQVKDSKTVTKTVLQNLKIVAVAQSMAVAGVAGDDSETVAKPKVANTVTLEVTPQEAETISFVTDSGRVNLSLRNSADNTTGFTTGVDKESSGVEPPPSPPKPRAPSKPVDSVEIILGTAHKTMTRP